MIGDKGLLMPAVGAVLVLTTGFFAVQDATGQEEGSPARSALSVIAPAAAGGGWDLAAREFQQATRTESIVNSVQVVNVPGAGSTIGLGQLQPGAQPRRRVRHGRRHPDRLQRHARPEPALRSAGRSVTWNN